jgi:hypothetical protein
MKMMKLWFSTTSALILSFAAAESQFTAAVVAPLQPKSLGQQNVHRHLQIDGETCLANGASRFYIPF